MASQMHGQLDMFAEAEAAERQARLNRPARCLYGSPARGLAARAADLQAWCAEFGGDLVLVRSHAWAVHITCPPGPTPYCQATVLSAEAWPVRFAASPDCGSQHDRLTYRGACRNPACCWEGPARDGENPAAEDACTHTFPGWEDLPVVDGPPCEPDGNAATNRWLARVTAACPEGWIERGGPFRSWRGEHGHRHVPARTPWGGYDLAVPGSPEGR
jgi:hypothetical protein